MGFDITATTVALEFQDGTPLAGATVRASLDVPIREFLGMQRALANARNGTDEMEAAYRRFGDVALISWDLERNGEPITADGEGMLSLPFSAANAVLKAWVEASTGPEGNSVSVSENGAQSEALSGVTAA